MITNRMVRISNAFHSKRYHPGLVPTWMNRRTGEPHEHKREIARRFRQQTAAMYKNEIA